MSNLKQLYKRKVKEIDRGPGNKKYSSIKFIAPLILVIAVILITFIAYKIDFRSIIGLIPYVSEQKNCSISVNISNGIGLVLLDDEEIGTTPLATYKVVCGTHKIQIKKTGEYSEFYAIHNETIDMPNKSALTVNIKLGPTEEVTEVLKYLEEPYSNLSLFVFSNSSNTLTIIDGITLGETPIFTGELSAGGHTLTFRSNGYEDTSVQIVMKDKRKITITVQLMKIPVKYERTE
ncbi:PEGA domain-containing protein [Candidatus Dojkabacteria bacterium]|nr:PEGA domain-containing protein [Candidatus Dojkabacteria bacterium]